MPELSGYCCPCKHSAFDFMHIFVDILFDKQFYYYWFEAKCLLDVQNQNRNHEKLLRITALQ